MDFLKEIFGVTRGRPEVNHELKNLVCSSRCYQSSLLELQPHFWQLTFFPPTFFLWLSIALTHFGREKDSWWHIPGDICLTTLYSLRMMTNSVPFYSAEELSNFTGFFTKDWMNNVASLLTYCSICWPGNNLTQSINSLKREKFMHSKDLSDVIFLLGFFWVKKKISKGETMY